MLYLLSQLEGYDCVIFGMQDQNRTGYVLDTKRQTDRHIFRCLIYSEVQPYRDFIGLVLELRS